MRFFVASRDLNAYIGASQFKQFANIFRGQSNSYDRISCRHFYRMFSVKLSSDCDVSQVVFRNQNCFFFFIKIYSEA